MEFRIADTFTDSLSKLTSDEQKKVQQTAFSLQLNPENPSYSFHKLERAQDPNFWSVRTSRDIRIIIHRTKSSLLFCYVNHHDKAYAWAERRKLQTHPKTGAAQLVEIRERVVEIKTPIQVQEEKPTPEKPLLFKDYDDEDLLILGVPPEWLGDIKQADEDSLLELSEHLPAEATNHLLELAVGGTLEFDDLKDITGDWKNINPFDHPDAKRRFFTVEDTESLERAFDYPWEKWTIFLHPAQASLLKKNFNGPARVSGSAGTGKTIVALHRAVFLARNNSDARVLLTTFSNSLASALKTKLKRLISNEPRLGERIEVYAIDTIAKRLYQSTSERLDIINDDEVELMIAEIARKVEANTFSQHFLVDEWQQVVDAWQLMSWEQYRDVRRLGRKTQLREAKRLVLWSIYEQLQIVLRNQKKITMAGVFTKLFEKFKNTQSSPFEYVVVDESQDISIPQLRFVAALGGDKSNALFFAGDLGQRIFHQPFSWKSLGVDIRGRSSILRVNYRTSHQIRKQADRLLEPEFTDVDGNIDDRRGTVSVFNGADPLIKQFGSHNEESEFVSEWLKKIITEDYKPHEICIVIRSSEEISRAKLALDYSEIPYKVLDEYIEVTHGYISIAEMHFVKGLEFRAVVVMACDDEIIPSQKRIENVSDNADLEEVYNTERHLLYVACTRARDKLLLTSGNEPSEFLSDINKI